MIAYALHCLSACNDPYHCARDHFKILFFPVHAQEYLSTGMWSKVSPGGQRWDAEFSASYYRNMPSVFIMACHQLVRKNAEAIGLTERFTKTADWKGSHGPVRRYSGSEGGSTDTLVDQCPVLRVGQLTSRHLPRRLRYCWALFCCAVGPPCVFHSPEHVFNLFAHPRVHPCL